MSKPNPQFEIRASSLKEASGLIAAYASTCIYEGLKSLKARDALGLAEPQIEGKPLSAFICSSSASKTEMLAKAAYLGRRTGLGALWIAHNCPGGPDEAFGSDADALAAISEILGRRV